MALSEAPLTTITAWYQDLPKRAREGLSLENLHRLSKALNAARSEPDERVKGLVEALQKIANMGQSIEPDHWKFRCMARNVSEAALSTYQDKRP